MVSFRFWRAAKLDRSEAERFKGDGVPLGRDRKWKHPVD